MSETLTNASRREFVVNGERVMRDELKVGALQRIAKATEAMSKYHRTLIEERDRFEQRMEYWCR